MATRPDTGRAEAITPWPEAPARARGRRPGRHARPARRSSLVAHAAPGVAEPATPRARALLGARRAADAAAPPRSGDSPSRPRGGRDRPVEQPMPVADEAAEVVQDAEVVEDAEVVQSGRRRDRCRKPTWPKRTPRFSRRTPRRRGRASARGPWPMRRARYRPRSRPPEAPATGVSTWSSSSARPASASATAFSQKVNFLVVSGAALVVTGLSWRGAVGATRRIRPALGLLLSTTLRPGRPAEPRPGSRPSAGRSTSPRRREPRRRRPPSGRSWPP